jgi:hypothetical protein
VPKATAAMVRSDAAPIRSVSHATDVMATGARVGGSAQLRHGGGRWPRHQVMSVPGPWRGACSPTSVTPGDGHEAPQHRGPRRPSPPRPRGGRSRPRRRPQRRGLGSTCCGRVGSRPAAPRPAPTGGVRRGPWRAPPSSSRGAAAAARRLGIHLPCGRGAEMEPTGRRRSPSRGAGKRPQEGGAVPPASCRTGVTEMGSYANGIKLGKTHERFHGVWCGILQGSPV